MGVGGMSVRLDSDADEGEEEGEEADDDDDVDNDDDEDSLVSNGNAPEGVIEDAAEIGVAVVVAYSRP